MIRGACFLNLNRITFSLKTMSIQPTYYGVTQQKKQIRIYLRIPELQLVNQIISFTFPIYLFRYNTYRNYKLLFTFSLASFFSYKIHAAMGNIHPPLMTYFVGNSILMLLFHKILP